MAKTTKEKTEQAALGFEQGMEQLEQLVAGLEDGGLTLEQSLAAYEQGMTLHARLSAMLEAGEKRIQVLQGKEGAAVDFEVEA